jgi:hypothetical protein
LTKRLHILVIVTAVLLAPSLIFAGNSYHKFGADEAKMKDNVLEVPLVITNQDNLAAMDIPLQFSEGVTLKEVKFEGTKVEYFDLKVANIDNENRTVVIGLLPQMTPEPKPDLEAGTWTIANLIFEVNEAGVSEVKLEAIELQNPHHSLMFVYHEFDANGTPSLKVEKPEFSSQVALAPEPELPSTFGLSQNYPNPFNPTTTLEFSLEQPSEYTMKIYNITGQEVESFNGIGNKGLNRLVFEAGGYASGVYFYKLEAEGKTATKKMVLLK